MKKSAVWTIVLMSASLSAVAVSVNARADDPVSERHKVASFEKDAAQDQLKISQTKIDVKTQQVLLKRDIAQFGIDSNQARADRDKLRDMRKTLADQKADKQKDVSKKDAQAGGQVPAESMNDSSK